MPMMQPEMPMMQPEMPMEGMQDGA
jgi:hypothetical protein